MIVSRASYRLLTLIILMRLIACLWFMSNMPLWEKADEINHYQYARFIAHEGRLPTPEDIPDQPLFLSVQQQYNQPPLYYLLLAPIIHAFDKGPMPTIYANPVPLCAVPFEHYFIHTQAEQFPYQGIYLAAWLGRFITVGLGLLATLFVWLAAREFWPENPPYAPIATAVFALMPATIDLTIWMNNDAPLLLFGAMTLYFIGRTTRESSTWRVWMGVGLSTLLCIATKLNGLAIVPVVLLALTRWMNQHVTIKIGEARLRSYVVIAFPLLIAGIAFAAYNHWQCGLLLCRLHRYNATFNSLESFLGTLSGPHFTLGFTQFFRTAAAPFLVEAYAPSLWLLLVGWVLIFGSVVGLLRLPRYLHDHRWILLGILLSALALALLRVWWLQVGYMPVRYIAVAMPALSLLLAMGYVTLMKAGNHRWPPRKSAIPIAAILGFAWITSVAPLFHYRPLLVSPERFQRLPANIISITDYRFASGVQLGGYAYASDQIRIYMKTTRLIPEPLFAWVITYDTAGQPLEECAMTAGGAWWSTLDWQRDEWVAQDFVFPQLAQAKSFDVRLFYLQNNDQLINAYDASRPDTRLSGDKLPLHR